MKKIQETGLGPTILEVTLRFMRELCLRDEIVIESQLLSYKKKIARMIQHILKKDEVCCKAEFVFGLFDIRQRTLVLPTTEWLKAVGYEA